LIDGELILENSNFNSIQSSIMSEDGTPDFRYIVFDQILKDPSELYEQRLINLDFLHSKANFIQFLNVAIVHNIQELLEWEKIILNEGCEGIILRSPRGIYKFGRSTLKESYLMKFKRFHDSEAIILSSNEQLSNCNELELDELGYSKRSSAQANLVGNN